MNLPASTEGGHDSEIVSAEQLSIAEANYVPNTPEIHELARIANDYRDQHIARIVLQATTVKLSTLPPDKQMQARELVGQLPRSIK